LDDFGIAPVEAMAAARPVVAFGRGGALDTVIDGETGVLFRQPTPAALGEALDRLERTTVDADRRRAHARRFDRTSFEEQFSRFVDARLAERGANASKSPT